MAVKILLVRLQTAYRYIRVRIRVREWRENQSEKERERERERERQREREKEQERVMENNIVNNCFRSDRRGGLGIRWAGGGGSRCRRLFYHRSR